MKKYEKIIIGLLICILIIITASLFKKNEIIVQNIAPEKISESIGAEVISATMVVDTFEANYSSVSATTDDDIISYSTDAPTVASLSAGDIIFFEGGGIDDAGITANYPYYVLTASTSTGFEITSNSADTSAIDITAAFTGGETFYELPNTTNGDLDMINVSEAKYKSVSVDCQGSTVSASWNFVGGLSDAEPNVFATQSYNNEWDEIYVNDIESSTGTAGATGFETTSAYHKIFKIYPETIKWFGIRFTDLETGTCTVKLRATD
jgi:hypothetical protein